MHVDVVKANLLAGEQSRCIELLRLLLRSCEDGIEKYYSALTRLAPSMVMPTKIETMIETSEVAIASLALYAPKELVADIRRYEPKWRRDEAWKSFGEGLSVENDGKVIEWELNKEELALIQSGQIEDRYARRLKTAIDLFENFLAEKFVANEVRDLDFELNAGIVEYLLPLHGVSDLDESALDALLDRLSMPSELRSDTARTLVGSIGRQFDTNEQRFMKYCFCNVLHQMPLEGEMCFQTDSNVA